MKFQDQKKIQAGSSKLINKEAFDKDNYMIENMHLNAAYIFYLDKNNINDKSLKNKVLQEFKKNYSDYRNYWTNVNKNIIENKITNNLKKPYCIDIEVASICDLACPHCYREYIVTPDKIMKEELFKKIINQIEELQVPSIKLNWRGEPLLNPKILEFIDLAKKAGVIEVSINTNATTLDEKKAEKLINSGLDQIIFSFDGGSKKTYEKMRPGRFKDNKFDKIYENIKNFCIKKKELNKFFPITKIQMVMTKTTRNEVDSFFNLFSDIIDDVVVTQYQERGGNLDDITDEQKDKIQSYQKNNSICQYIAKANGDLLVSTDRKTCDQPYQRLMIAYNGQVGMCCHDWGARHCVGYLDEDGINNYDKELNETLNNVKNNKKGFELLKNVEMPEKFYEAEKKISTLKEIWMGKELQSIRSKHEAGHINQINVCKNCTYKNSYNWKKI
tara:strand:- start:460 stop:1791 length:1332 start_codon:yes stop_codon:yes gene_type:complete